VDALGKVISLKSVSIPKFVDNWMFSGESDIRDCLTHARRTEQMENHR
jgi:hypothetical protein